GRIVVGRIEGQPSRSPAADGDDEDVVTAVPVGGEGKGTAVRAEDGVDVVGNVLRDGACHAANGLDGPDVAEVAEGDQLAVGRDVRSTGHPDRFLRSTNGG